MGTTTHMSSSVFDRTTLVIERIDGRCELYKDNEIAWQ